MSVFTTVCLLLYSVPILHLFLKLASLSAFFVSYLIRLIRRRPKNVDANLQGGLRNQQKRHPFHTILSRLNYLLGAFEYAIRIPRNIFFGIFLALLVLVNIMKYLLGMGPLVLNFQIFVYLLILGLIGYTAHNEIIISLKLAEFLRQNPSLHPEVFFKLSKELRSPHHPELPAVENLSMVTPEKVSFKKETRAHQSLWYFFPILVDTAYLAHTSLRALRYMGDDFARDVFDVMASMWGKRLLQITKSSLDVRGGENIQNLKGKILLILNHKSQLDFALAFFALSHIRLSGGRRLRPRFITARDHFLDNPLVYQVLGIGKLIEAVDMVFIDRKKGARGIFDLTQAARFLATKEIDIAIFPQGTRAEGNFDRSEKRRDAGYYTTVPPKDIESDWGHLRKGTAFLTVDTLCELAEGSGEDLNLVFVGNAGTATTLSKQSLKIQTETDITYEIGKPLTLSPKMAEGLKKPEGTSPENPAEKKYLELVEDIHKKIDLHLCECLRIHESLRHRFFLDLKGHFRLTKERLQQVEEELDRHAKEGSLSYQILDRIYACPPAEWNPFISEFSQLLIDRSPAKRLKTLRTQVTLKMLECLKTKVHGKKIKKRHLKMASPAPTPKGPLRGGGP